MWHKPFCADLRSDTFAALCGLLGSFGTEWATGPPAAPQPPFASWLEQQDLVSCVLRLLCCHVTLAADSSSRGGGGNPRGRKEGEQLLREGERRRLEAVLYSLVNLQGRNSIDVYKFWRKFWFKIRICSSPTSVLQILTCLKAPNMS